MNVHKESDATLIGNKIIVVFDRLTRGPELMASRGHDRAQYMSVEGKDEPALAVIDIRLSYVKKR
ncbi:hypothetical protein MUP77_14825 [Candidatus Bathyarchaeota archaeon]|nr:hypothetical protein [Candidatus Bathyarchaeota archaeon]